MTLPNPSHTKLKVQYVTALQDISGRSLSEMLLQFKPFLQTSLPFCIFTDQEALPIDLSYNVVPKHELRMFQKTQQSLPVQRNHQKDTHSFLQLMNAKFEFLERAKKLVDADVQIWIDFGILKVSKNIPSFLQRLSRCGESVLTVPGKIILPGCLKQESVNQEFMYSFPIWRFCGGVMIVPRDVLDEFTQLHNEEIALCDTLSTLTWEVNLLAAMERRKPELFHWQKADHNDSIVDAPNPGVQKRVILLSMIKNESKIIQRLIQSCIPFVDAVCIVDTGSTDNTVQILNDFIPTISVPGKIFAGSEHTWKNFGHNRSLSFKACVQQAQELGQNLEDTYALAMDADMELVPGTLQKAELTSNGQKIIQKSHTLEYQNSRFLRLSHPWVCTGVTHEQWDGGATDTLSKEQIQISDIGDGGCKADKFERDVRLLTEGLKESPGNPRQLFYLAQSQKDSKQLDKAIEQQKLRIEAGGWQEEIWQSMYQLMKLQAEKRQPAEMEYWGLKAQEFRKERAENLLYLVGYFKDRRDQQKAWHQWLLGSKIQRPNDMLFIETDCQTRRFDYERCIIHDQVFPNKKHETMDQSLNQQNKHGDQCMQTNLEWFVERIPGKVRALNFPDQGDYVPTSTSMLRQMDGTQLLNVRQVNYRIQPNGGYMMMENGVLSGDNPVRTKNYMCTMDTNFFITSELKEMNVVGAPLRNSRIKGLEDVRIFRRTDGQIGYFGTTTDYSQTDKIRQVQGIYDVDNALMKSQSHLKPATETDCEKNWIPYSDDRMIYAWHPFQIGKSDSDGRLVIEKRQVTPRFFSHMRGSTALVYDNGYYQGITHCVMQKQPRKQQHMLVKIDAATDTFVEYTHPFFFQNNAIEQCLGFEKRGASQTAIVSQNDRNPIVFQFEDSSLVWRKV